MPYTAADTIAYRLSKLSPWVPMRDGEWCAPCKFCEAVKDFGYTGEHDPECLWLNARQYIEVLNAPASSQEVADSPIESRVSELLGETETDTWAVCGTYGKCGNCSICMAWENSRREE